jgi:hypothetical protein
VVPPPATRAAAPGWRDPRLWVGVTIVAASVVAGSRVLAAADDTVAVWTVGQDAAAGEVLAPDDLVSERVRFADESLLAGYFTTDDALPDDLRLLRGLGAGELLPRAAIGEADATGTVEISVAVAPLQVPPAVTSGSVVDVYLTDRAAQARGEAAAEPVLTEVTVVEAPRVEETFATSGERQVVLAVDADAVGTFYGALDAMAEPVVTVVRLG